jgi:hypothetical protein
MAFTVPNRPDTDIQADQAEPDKGDFQTLGYRKSGVISGGAVSRTASNTVTVTPVSGYLNGEYFNITSDTVLSLGAGPSASSNSKFILIIIDKPTNGDINVTSLIGNTSNFGESATNSRFPDFDSTSRMLLAVVYYAVGDTDVTRPIVDKRVFVLPQANPTVITSTPGSSVGAIGEIRIDSNMTPDTGQTRIYVKTDATTWTNLGSASGGGTTTEEVQDIVGAMFTTGATHSGISAVYDDTGGGVDLTGSTEWNLTVAGSTANIGGSDTVAINISSDAEVSLSHSNGTITINDEWPRIRTMTHNSSGATKPAHYIYSDPWGQTTHGFGGPSGTGQFIYTRLQTGDINSMVPNGHACGSQAYKWSVLWVYGNAYAGGHAYSSDRNLKMNFGSAPGLSFVKGLMPVSFSWKDRAEETEWGFIAQDIEELCSQQDCDPLTLVDIVAESGERYLNYAGIIAPLVNAVQELVARVEALENG